MTSVLTQDRDLLRREFAETALLHRIHPARSAYGSTSQLFALEQELESRRRSLRQLARSFHATAPEAIGSEDLKTFRRECQRRGKRIEGLERERAGLLEAYVDALLASRIEHPQLDEIAERLRES